MSLDFVSESQTQDTSASATTSRAGVVFTLMEMGSAVSR
jgi:hypothetical protein